MKSSFKFDYDTCWHHVPGILRFCDKKHVLEFLQQYFLLFTPINIPNSTAVDMKKQTNIQFHNLKFHAWYRSVPMATRPPLVTNESRLPKVEVRTHALILHRVGEELPVPESNWSGFGNFLVKTQNTVPFVFWKWLVVHWSNMQFFET